MVKKNEVTEQNAVVAEQTEATSEENTDKNTLDAVEVPENAEQISNDEALNLAADEVNKLRAELDEANEKCKAAYDAIKILEDEKKALEEKCNDCETKGTASFNNTSYIELLNRFEAVVNAYSEARRERLRKEFVTDLKEEIQKQRNILTNA